MTDGDFIEGKLFGLKRYDAKKTTSRGDKMVSAVLIDENGEYNAKAWKESYENCLGVKEGDVVKVWGQAKPDYRDKSKVEISLNRFEKAEGELRDFMPKLNLAVLDIETVGMKYEEFDEHFQEYIHENLNKHLDEEDKQVTAFYPITAFIVCIAMHQSKTNIGITFYIDNEKTQDYEKDGNRYVVCKDEKDLLKKFWDKVTDYELLVTYNGNTFDMPFINWRSGINKVKVTKDIMGSRYDTSKHIDLNDELTYFKSHRSYKLDFVSRAFGITSPKEEGLDGSKVTEYYYDNKCEEIADYCLRDVKATYELYNIWNDYMRI